MPLYENHKESKIEMLDASKALLSSVNPEEETLYGPADPASSSDEASDCKVVVTSALDRAAAPTTRDIRRENTTASFQTLEGSTTFSCQDSLSDSGVSDLLMAGNTRKTSGTDSLFEIPLNFATSDDVEGDAMSTS